MAETVPLTELDPVARHRAVAERFTALSQAVTDWDDATPVDGWVCRDVVRHLTTWSTEFLAAGGVGLPDPRSVDDDPAAAWVAHANAVQALLDDRAVAEASFDHPQAGTHQLADAVDRFYTADVFMHTWDLARSIGRDPKLDPWWCEELLAGMEPMDEMLRNSGHYGPRMPVPDGADGATRLAAFIGRDPAWRPDGA